LAPLTLKPESPAYGGAMVAREDGKAVFVYYALPGETVEAEPRGRRGGVSFAKTTRVVEASPDRTTPRSPQYGECGGCHLQHASYERQLELKRRVVEDAWSRAGLRLPPDAPVLGMDEPWRYRIRGEFEAVYGRDGSFDFGLHRLRSHSVVPVHICPIHDERIERGLDAFRAALAEAKVDGVQNLTLTVEPNGDGLLWRVRFEGRPRATLSADLVAEVAKSLPHQTLLDDSMAFEFWGLSFRVRNDTFVQTNYRQMLVLYRVALDFLEPTEGMKVLDLFAGIGTISLALAQKGATVTAVEENPRAVQMGTLATRINAIESVVFKTGRVERVLKQIRLGEHDAVVLDPPRAGCEPAALAELLRLGPQRVVYISCDPITHARDLALLVRGGYRIRKAAIVDMFPQTYHIESVALLERASS
jgi:23S rRNA (uracil1939-C5)-methyltransferase